MGQQEIEQRRGQSECGQGNVVGELPKLNETTTESDPSPPPLLKRQCGSVNSSSGHCQYDLGLISPRRDDSSGGCGLAASPGGIGLGVGGGTDRLEPLTPKGFRFPRSSNQFQFQIREEPGNAKTFNSQCSENPIVRGRDDDMESSNRNDPARRTCSSGNNGAGIRFGSHFFTPPRVAHKQTHQDPSQFNRNRANTFPNRPQRDAMSPAVENLNISITPASNQSPDEIYSPQSHNPELFLSPQLPSIGNTTSLSASSVMSLLERRPPPSHTQFFTPQRNITRINYVPLSSSSALLQMNETSSSSGICQTRVDKFTETCISNKSFFNRARANTCPHRPQSHSTSCDDSVAVSIRPRESDVDFVSDAIKDGITIEGGRSLFEEEPSIHEGSELEFNFARENVSSGSSERTQIFVTDANEEKSREQNGRSNNGDDATSSVTGATFSSPISRRRSTQPPLLSPNPRPDLPPTPAALGTERYDASALTATPSPVRRSFSIHSTDYTNGGEVNSTTFATSSILNSSNANVMTSPQTSTSHPSSSTSRSFLRNNANTATISDLSQHLLPTQSRRWATLLLKGFSILSLFVFLSYSYHNVKTNDSQIQKHYAPIEINYRDMALAFSTGGIPGIGSWTSGSSSNSGDSFGETVSDDAHGSGDDDGGGNEGPVVGADGTPVIKLSDFMQMNKKTEKIENNSIPDNSEEVSIEAKKKRRPAMSHARSSYATSPLAKSSRQRRTSATIVNTSSFSSSSPTSSEWSFSKITWILISMGFMLPVFEMWWRELHRRFPLFFGHRHRGGAGVRRMRSLSDAHVQ